jgi:ATP-binding cassette, subfamily F, member 3
MRAKDVLLTALQEYTGTVIFVSHDRYFIDKLATRIFEVEDGRVTVYPGNYEDYLWRKTGQAAQAGPQGASSPELEGESLVPHPAANQAPGDDKAAAAPPAKGERRLNPIKLRQMKERRHEIEEEVTRLETEIADYEAALANFVSAEETRRVSGLLDSRRADLDALMTEWEQVAQAIEANS